MSAVRLALCLAVLAGCDPQVDPTYPGEAMATLRGTIAGFGIDVVSETAAIHWNANRGAYVPSGPIMPAILQARPPASLRLLVLSQPPPEAFFGVEGENVRLAEGYFHLVRSEAGDELTIDDFTAVALDTALIYVDGIVEPDSLTAEYIGGALSPGYHLVRWRATAELGDAQTYFADRCRAETGSTECALRRRYQLTSTPLDLGTSLTFVSRDGP